MKKLYLAVLGATATLSMMGAAYMGGWAVVSVDNVPDYIVAGKPVTLTFVVRQHAVTPRSDLSPTIEARSGSRTVQGMTWATSTPGGYGARITVPTVGEWQITINSGWGHSRGILLPILAIDSTARPPAPMAAAERGRRLFAAKGCVTCHVRNDVDIAGELRDYGPNLSDRKFPADYLAKFLANPAMRPPLYGK